MSQTSSMEKGYLIDLHLLDYGKALKIQREIHTRRVANQTRDTLILTEHPPVITVGKSGKLRNLLVPLSELRRRGISFYETERGGDITLHGPGQLVGYPIFGISDGLAGVRAFVRGLESALVLALARLGVKADGRPKDTGVWVGDHKIASIGVAVKRRVALHGFALYVHPDLALFKLINPCGKPAQPITSIQEVLGQSVSMQEVKREIRLAMERVFGLQLWEVQLEA